MVLKATECRFAKHRREGGRGGERERERQKESESAYVCVRRSKHTHMHRFCFTGQFLLLKRVLFHKPQLLVVRVNSASTRGGEGSGVEESGVEGSGLQGLGLSGVHLHQAEVSYPRHQHQDFRISRQTASGFIAPKSVETNEENVGVFPGVFIV